MERATPQSSQPNEFQRRIQNGDWGGRGGEDGNRMSLKNDILTSLITQTWVQVRAHK